MALKELDTLIQHPFESELVLADAGLMRPKQELKPDPPAAFSPRQLELTNQVFDLNTATKKLLLSHIHPLKDNEKKEKTMELLNQLYELIRIGGTLGIKYEFSQTRDPKTPDAVLVKEKDGNLYANCNELSLLFVAAAKYLNADMSAVGLINLKFNIELGLLQPEQTRHTLALEKDDKKYIVDFTFKEIGIHEVSSFDSLDISNVYRNKETPSGKIIDVLALQTAETLPEMAALQFKQQASVYYHQNMAGKMEKVIDALEKALILNPSDSRLREIGAQNCCWIAEQAYPFRDPSQKGSWDPQKAEKYIRKALTFESDNFIAHSYLASLYFDTKKYALAIPEYEAALKSDPSSLQTQHDLLRSLVNLKRFKEAETLFTMFKSKNINDPEQRSVGFDIYAGLNDFHKLLGFAEEVLSIKGDDGEAHRNRVSALFELSRQANNPDVSAEYLARAKAAAKEALDSLPTSNQDYQSIRAWLSQFPESK
jgi:tetratricopeptide (TPR) repeat protein